MTTMKFSALAAVVVWVSACGTDAAPEGGEIGVDTVPEPVVTEASRRVPLQDMIGGNVSGELLVTPLPDSVVFRIDLNGAAPQTTYAVRVQTGTCENAGADAAVLESLRTGALGNGTSHRSVTEGWQRLLDGRHVVGIYAPTADPGSNRPLACAPVPAQ